MYDMTPDDFGIALGLGEEIAMDDRSGEMSQQESDGVLGDPVSKNRDLIPVSQFNKDSKIVDLTNHHNWVVDFTRRLRSPFIEKWKMVALGNKTPDCPLLTEREAQAYYAAYELIVIDNDDDKRCQQMVNNIQRLKEVRSRVNMQYVGEEILRRRYAYGKD